MASTRRISYSIDGQPFEFQPSRPSISDDGRYVAFVAPFFYEEIRQASRVSELHNSVFVRDTVAPAAATIFWSRVEAGKR
jgi:hypothetical protein